MAKTYRQGAIGAILDEYERSITDLETVISDITDTQLPVIVDAQTYDDDCRSVQTVLAHVVHSGYGYATGIWNLKGVDKVRPAKTPRTTIQEYIADLDAMFAYTENILTQFRDDELEQIDDDYKIKAGWGKYYDIEQMMEHAIVHILRHRRQLEKFKLLLAAI
jgi:uncharacterized damage-inducible protein DinB